MTEEQKKALQEKYGTPKTPSREELIKKYGEPKTAQTTTQPSQPLSFDDAKDKVLKNENIFSRIGDVFKKRQENIQEIANREIAGGQTGAESLLQTAGQVAGGVGDVAMESLGALTDLPVLKQIKGFLGDKAKKVLETEIGQQGIKALQGGMEMYNAWKKENPRAAANLEGVVNIASLIPAGKVVGGTGKVATDVAKTAGVGIAKTGLKEGTEQALQKQIKKEALEVITTKPTKKEAIEALASGQGKKTLTKGIVIEPSKYDTQIADAISGVVNKNKSGIDNISSIKSKVEEINQGVIDSVKQTPAIFNEKQILSALEKTKAKSGVIFGNEKPQYDAVIDFMNTKIKEQPKTLEGLLAARKSFDAEINSKFPNILGQEAGDNARRNAVLDVRREINNYIADKLPEGNTFKESLKQQHLMLEGVDRIAQNEAKNINKNALTKLNDFVKNNPATALAGLGGVGSAAVSGLLTNPYVLIPTLLGVGTYKVGKKVLTSKELKKFVIDAISQMEKIDPKNIELLKGLKDIATGTVLLEGAGQLEK